MFSFNLSHISYNPFLVLYSCPIWINCHTFFSISFSGILVVVVQFLSRVWLFATPWTVAHQASVSFTISLSRLKLMSIESVMPSNYLILCCPLILLSSIFPSIRVFSNKSALYSKWPKYWSFSFNPSPSSEYSGLISFRTDWFDILAIQGAPERLLQHHSLKASILWHSPFFMVHLSHPHMTTEKTIAFTIWTFVSKVISLFSYILSRLVITFLPRRKHLLIVWLQSLSTVILEPENMKSDTVSTISPSIFHEVMGPDGMILVFWILSFKPFHTVHAVLKARILKWFAIPFSSRPPFVRTLHHDLFILDGPAWYGS